MTSRQFSETAKKLILGAKKISAPPMSLSSFRPIKIPEKEIEQFVGTVESFQFGRWDIF